MRGDDPSPSADTGPAAGPVNSTGGHHPYWLATNCLPAATPSLGAGSGWETPAEGANAFAYIDPGSVGPAFSDEGNKFCDTYTGDCGGRFVAHPSPSPNPSPNPDPITLTLATPNPKPKP